MFRSRLSLFPVLFVVLLLVVNGPTAVKADTVIQNIGVGTTPMDVAVNPAGTRLYVANQGSNSVTVIDASATPHTVITTVGLSSTCATCIPTNLAVSPDGSKVYVVSQTSPGSIQVLNTATNSFGTAITTGIGNNPIDVAFDSTGRAFVTNYSSQSVTVLNTNGTHSVINVHEGPRGITVTNVPGAGGGERVYVAFAGASNSEVGYMPVAGSSFNYISVSGGPFFVAARPDGTKVYASLNVANQTASISTASNTVLTYLADFGGLPFGIAVAATPTGNRVFVADSNGTGFGNYSLTRIDSGSDTQVGQVFVGKKPKGVAANAAGTRIYVACSGQSRVDVIDTTF